MDGGWVRTGGNYADMESGWKSNMKKARGLDGEIEKVFGERERLRD